jgi:hypothetical protein
VCRLRVFVSESEAEKLDSGGGAGGGVGGGSNAPCVEVRVLGCRGDSLPAGVEEVGGRRGGGGATSPAGGGRVARSPKRATGRSLWRPFKKK